MKTTDANHAGNKLPTPVNGVAPSTGDSQFLQSLLAQANGETSASGPPALSSTPTLGGLLQALRRRWPVALGLATLAAALAVFVVLQLLPPKYLVSIRLRVVAKQHGSEDVEFPIYKANMEWLVKSPLVLNAALNEKLPDGREVKDLDLIRGKGMAAVEWLEKAMKTEYVLNAPEILRVTLAADHPEEGAEVLNAIVKAFLNEVAEMDRTKRQQRLTELRNIKERHEENKRSLHGILKSQMQTLGVKDHDTIKLELERLNQEQTAVKIARRTTEEEIAKYKNETISLRAKLKNLDGFRVPEDYLEDAFAKDLRIAGYDKTIQEIELTIADYSAKYVDPFLSREVTPKKHERLRVKLLRQQREKELLPEIERKYRNKVREELEHQLALVGDKLIDRQQHGETLSRDVNELDGKIRDLVNSKPPAQIQATEGKIELAWKDVEETAKKIREVELEGLNARVRPLENAKAPASKDFSRQIKFGSVGGLGMFGLALFGVAFMEFRSRKISVTEEVTHGLGLNVVGTVPAMPARSRKPSTSNDAQDQLWQNQLHESVDAIRTVLLHNARSVPLRVIMVTSANSGEGKTTLATQLAASLARAWKRTLIIDGDLRHPATHQLFDVPQEPGLSEVLRGEVEVADAIRATPFSRLWILPAGNGDSHAVQALAQDSVEAIFESLKQQYDFIIVDSPPVLPVTDSLLLGQHVDGVLLSILRDVSRAPAVYAAQQKLAPLGVHTLGAVVLGTQPDFGNKNYRYAMMPSK